MLRRMWECAVLSTLLASAALAETGTWEPIGPEGGNFSAIAIDPDDPERLFAISNYTLFRRDRSDGEWTVVEHSNSRAVAVGAGGRVYLAGDRLARSDDHGQHFEPLEIPDDPYTFTVAVAPSNADVVYVATPAGVRRSSDGGRTFAARGEGLPAAEAAFALAVDPVDADTIYAAVRSAGAFVSRDGAATWSSITAGLPCPTSVPYQDGCVVSLALTNADPPALLVGVAASGLMRSVDEGVTWQAADGAIVGQYVTAIASPPMSDGYVSPVAYAGVASDDGYSDVRTPTRFQVLLSGDGGESWRAVGETLPAAVAALAVADGPLYAATGERGWVGLGYEEGSGLYRSDDDGASWRLDQRGLHGTCLAEIAAAPTSRTTLHAVSRYDATPLYSSASGGDGWRRIALPGAFTIAFDVDPNDPNHLYAVSGDARLSVSRDGGAEWTGVPPATAALRYPADLVVDARDGDTVYAIVSDDGVHSDVLKSVDGGATWRATLSADAYELTRKLALDPASDTVYAVFTHELYRSRDAGETWAQILAVAPDKEAVYDFAVAPTSPPTLLRTGTSGVFVSRDDGESWQRPRLGGSRDAFYTDSITVDPDRALTLYAIAGALDGTRSGLYRSDDGGSDWRRIGPIPSAGYYFSGLAVDPHDRASLYAATCGGGVQRFTQAARTGDGSGSGDGCAVVPPDVSAAMLAAHGLAIGLLALLRTRR